MSRVEPTRDVRSVPRKGSSDSKGVREQEWLTTSPDTEECLGVFVVRAALPLTGNPGGCPPTGPERLGLVSIPSGPSLCWDGAHS